MSQEVQEQTDAQPTIEKEAIDNLINPSSARVLARVAKKSSFDPIAVLKPEDEVRFKELIVNKTPENLDFASVEALADDSRRAYQKQKEEKERKAAEAKEEEYTPKTLQERVAEWNKDTSDWIKENAEEGAPNRDEFLSALKTVDLDDMDNLSTKVGAFYNTYLEGGTHVGDFVKKLAEAEDLKTGEHIDLGKLKTRLTAISGLLSTFGEEIHDEEGNVLSVAVDKLVADYAAAYGLASQSKENKKVVAETILSNSQNPVHDGPEKQRLEALNKKHIELKEFKIGEQLSTTNSEGGEEEITITNIDKDSGDISIEFKSGEEDEEGEKGLEGKEDTLRQDQVKELLERKDWTLQDQLEEEPAEPETPPTPAEAEPVDTSAGEASPPKEPTESTAEEPKIDAAEEESTTDRPEDAPLNEIGLHDGGRIIYRDKDKDEAATVKLPPGSGSILLALDNGENVMISRAEAIKNPDIFKAEPTAGAEDESPAESAADAVDQVPEEPAEDTGNNSGQTKQLVEETGGLFVGQRLMFMDYDAQIEEIEDGVATVVLGNGVIRKDSIDDILHGAKYIR